jgi:hypothetical protein
MSADAVPSSSDTPESPTPRPLPARRVTQRELVILSLLARPDDSRVRRLT